ncbi:MAG: NB-ARC domain-containing protein [Gemmatimonadetes bacterium]|nr:NB-ARC domain-containing protein [Gemmatimonadota bacterium]
MRRPELESELRARLEDRNHPIITLHGGGGIGKTALALRIAHDLALVRDPLFDEVIWFSARDVDLALHGPRDVRPAVLNLEMIATVYGSLFNSASTIQGFSAALRMADPQTSKGKLFVFDNCETLADTRGVQQFLDTHTHLPNKVVISSRERAFKADYHIQVRGMEWNEAQTLIARTARLLGAEPLVDADVTRRIFDYAEGHPYVMKILVGETAKEGRYVAPKTLLPRRLDILDAVFERSFNRLAPEGRWVVLLASNWSSAIAEIAFLVVMAQRDLDAGQGIEECERLALINDVTYTDEVRAYYTPQIARIFGRKKLSGDPDRLLIQEDLQVIQQFGVLPTSEPIRSPSSASLERFAQWCLQTAEMPSPVSPKRLDQSLQVLADLWPPAWLHLARLRIRGNASREDIAYAFRRAVEEFPTSKEAWRVRRSSQSPQQL